MRFLFRLDLNLHADVGNFFWNFEVCIQTQAKSSDDAVSELIKSFTELHYAQLARHLTFSFF